MNNALEVKEQYIHTSIIHNPLEPVTSRKQVNLIWDCNKKLYDYLYDLPTEVEWGILFNGKTYTLEETKDVIPAPNTYLILTPVLTGGAGGNKGARLAVMALIAVAAVFTAGAAAAAAGCWAASAGAGAVTVAGATAGSTVAVTGAMATTYASMGLVTGFTGLASIAAGVAGAAAYAGTMAVGMALMDTLIPADTKKNNTLTSAETYGNDSIKPTTAEGSALGVCYGEYRIGGVVIQNKTMNRGDNQDCYVLQALSEGEVESISDIYVNEQSISQYTNIETQTRNGTDNQELIPWFDDSYNVQSKSATLETDWATTRTKDNVDKFSIDLTFPMGLYWTHNRKKGPKDKQCKVEVQVQYKPVDETEWRPLVSNIKSEIRELRNFADGSSIKFITPEGHKDFEIRFHNIIYEDCVVDDERVVYYLKTGDTSTVLNNIIKLFDTKNDKVETPDLSVTYEKYSNGEYNIIFTPRSFNYDFYTWDLQLEGDEIGVGTGFKGCDCSIFTYSDFSKSAIRKVIESPLLVNDRYDIRVRRTTEEGNTTSAHPVFDQVVWVDTNEILLDDITYNHTALLATKVQMNGQITSTPAVTALVKGVKVNKYNYDGEVVSHEWTDNPAWIALDILTNKRYGGGMSIHRVDLPKFIEWAEYCEENKLTFNGYINSESNIWDALNLVSITNHATIVFCGTKITLALDKPQEPIYLFNNSNIIKDTFKTDWSGVKDRYNSFELSFNDKNNFYETNTLKIIDSSIVENASEIRTLSINSIGITDEERANKELKRYVLRNKYQKQGVQFSAPIEAIGCTIGDVVIVQHDVPQWGFGGKLAENSNKSILYLDREVNMEFNKNYCILVKHDATMVCQAPVASIVGRSIFINQEIKEIAKRLIVNGKDYEIYKIIPGRPYTEIVVSEKDTCKVGDTVELWNTDVLEEADVVTNAYSATSTLQLKKELKYEPKFLDTWLFGYKDRYQKKFKIQSLSGLNTDTIEVNAIEYSDNYYNLDDYEGEEPNISMLDTKPRPITGLKCEEKLVHSGGYYSTDLIVSWDTRFANTYFGADIYVRHSANELFNKIGEARGGVNFYTIPNIEDDSYLEIKVVSFDSLGRRASFNDSPIIIHQIEGTQKKPDTPTNFEVRQTKQGLMLAWDIVNEADITGYIIKEGTEWASGKVIDDNVSNNRYTIQYSEAGLKTFMIKAKDAFGNESELPAYTSITLNPPLDPVDFMSVQNNDFIVLKWDNLDESVAKFRIKEGESWGAGTIVADVAGYSHSVPINGYYNRKFWIKSIDEFGVFCRNAIFSSPNALEHQTKNVIIEYDESGNKFPHPSLNMEVKGDYLITRDNAKYGEYNWYVDIGEKLYSRVISEDEVDCVQHSPIWKEFHNKWNSFEAHSPWTIPASLDNLRIERQMALPEPLKPDVKESFSFYLTPDGVNGTKPINLTEKHNYGNGRFREGIIVDDTSDLGYNINIGKVFSIKGWVRPISDYTSSFITLNGENGISLRLFFRSKNKTFNLIDNHDNTLSVKADYKKDEPILICLSQSLANRTLMIGFSKDLSIMKDTKPLPPLGTFTSMNFR